MGKFLKHLKFCRANAGILLRGIGAVFSIYLTFMTTANATTPQRFLILESYPWAFYEEDQVRGAGVDWLASLAARGNFALKPVVTSYARGVELLKRGDIDYMIAPNAPHYRDLGDPAFPLLTIPMVLVARPGINLTRTEHLMGLKSLGMVTGLTFDALDLEPLPLPPTEEVQPASALRRMSAGRLDALIISSFGLQAEALRQDIPVQRWPQRPVGSLTLSLFTGHKTRENPQTAQVLHAVREARDRRAYAPFLARYLTPPS